MGLQLVFPTIAHPTSSKLPFGGRGFAIHDTFKVLSRPIDRTEEGPIPPVGTPRVIGGFDLQ